MIPISLTNIYFTLILFIYFTFLPMYYTTIMTIINSFQELTKPLSATHLIDINIATYYIKQTAVLCVFHNNIHSVKKQNDLKKIDKKFHITKSCKSLLIHLKRLKNVIWKLIDNKTLKAQLNRWVVSMACRKRIRFGCFNPLTTSISRGKNFVRWSSGAWNFETIFTATWQSCRLDFAI